VGAAKADLAARLPNPRAGADTEQVPDNTAVAERAYERLRANDIEGALEYIDSDVEWHSLVLEIEGSFRGHDGVREWWRELRSVFPDWDPSIAEMRDLGDWVLVHARGMGQGAASGIGIDDDFWQVARFAQQRIVWYGAFRTEREAVEAAGLSD
jgi:ketosteroid isomerase-like protein